MVGRGIRKGPGTAIPLPIIPLPVSGLPGKKKGVRKMGSEKFSVFIFLTPFF
jgi:hypothetical protein